jgi:predicted nucleic acid-binding protein
MIYADSSFLVSRYVADVHSSEADRRMLKRPSVWLTPLNRAEIANALQRYVFRSAISAVEATEAWADFEQDCAQRVWAVIGLPEGVWESAIVLAQRFGSALGVRTLDSLHVACALELRVRRFWTFDSRQARLAKAVGLKLDP